MLAIIIHCGRLLNMSKEEQRINKAMNTWAKGIDYCVTKVGSKWTPIECFGNFPLFNTKKEAYDAVESFVFMPR